MRAAVALVVALGAGPPSNATAVSRASMANWIIPAGMSPAAAPASKVDVPVWSSLPASSSVTSSANGQLNEPGEQPRSRAVPRDTPPSRPIPLTRRVADPMPVESVIVPRTCTVSEYTKVAPVQPVFGTAAGYVTPPPSGASL